MTPAVTTTYTLTGMSDANAPGTVSGTASVNVNPLPACSITGNNNVCPASTNTYSAPAGMTIYSWSISGNGTISGATNLQNVSVIAGGTCGTHTLTLTITDGNGCINTCNQTYTISDNINPTISLTPAASLGCNPTAVQVAAAFGTATVSDNCTAALTVTSAIQTEVVTGCTVSVTKNWTATDACGNTTLSSQTINFTGLSPFSPYLPTAELPLIAYLLPHYLRVIFFPILLMAVVIHFNQLAHP